MQCTVLLLTAALALSVPVVIAADTPDTVIRGATVIDGSGAPGRVADVRIVGGRVNEIGTIAPRAGDRVVEARGLVLAPGFIDSHSHQDQGLMEHRDALGAISQGITTIVIGQDGESQLPLRDFFAGLDKQPTAVNVASYVGHGTLRSKVMGDDFRRAATEPELTRMRELLREEMEAGALGLSTGLEYDPGIFSDPSEVLMLAKSIAPLGGRYISHIRSEDRDFWPAIDELLHIGREAKIPVQISHMKLAMRGLWDQGDKLIAKLDAARAEGIKVTADVYPYTMWSSTLTVLYPKRNFADRAETEFILREIAAPEDLVIGNFDLEPKYEGKNVGEIAKMRGTDPATTLMALIAESQAKQANEGVVARGMDERDIESFYRWPYSSVSSDGELAGAHPRGFGSFPRVLGEYTRQRKVLKLEDAIRRMTSLPAASLGIERGTLRPGAVADLVLLDPATVADRATLQEPHALSVGIKSVWVGGEAVYADAKATGATPGRVLRRIVSGDARMLAIDRVVRAEMERQKIPGVAVGIIDHGVVTARGYGVANVEHSVPVTDETIFQSGSLGKMFTSTAVMLLVEDGKIALTDPLTKYFPAAPTSWKKITVRHLLTHTSGIPDYTTDTFDYRKDYTEDQLAKFAFAMPLEFAAGSRWNYSNTGYALLGFIVHKASGQFYGDVLAKRVFAPLGMTRTRIITEADIVPNRAAGYQLVDGQLKNQDWVAPQLNTTADGSLYFSMRDLVSWEAAVKRRAVLKAESWEQILTPVRLNSGKSYPYGFGWFIEERGGLPLHQHSGSWQGFKTQFSRFLGNDLSIVVLANLAQADPTRIADRIATIIDPRLAVPARAAIADAEPRVTAKLQQTLDALRGGTLTPKDLAYVRAGFFPAAAEYYKTELVKLGHPTKTVLVERREVGDDRSYLYELTFGDHLYLARLALAPDDRVSQFSLQPVP